MAQLWPLPDQAKGLLCIGTAAFVGSTFGVIMRVLGRYGPFGILAVRSLIQGSVMVGASLYMSGPRKVGEVLRSMDRLSACAVLAMAGQNLGISLGVLTTSVSNCFFVINTGPAVCILSDFFVLKERVRPRTWLMVATCLAGISVIVVGTYQSGGELLGCFIALLNPVSWAAFWGIQRRRAREGGTKEDLPIILLGAQAVIMVVSAIGVALDGGRHASEGIREASQAGELVRDLLTFLGFSGLYMPMLQVLFSLAPRYIPTAEVACVKVTESIWGTMWAFVFLNQVPGPHTLGGGGLILAAVVSHSLAALRELKAAKATPARATEAVVPVEPEPHTPSKPSFKAVDLDPLAEAGAVGPQVLGKAPRPAYPLLSCLPCLP